MCDVKLNHKDDDSVWCYKCVINADLLYRNIAIGSILSNILDYVIIRKSEKQNKYWN